MKLGPKLLAATLACGVAAAAEAGTSWDETVNGDLSNDGLAPTPLAVSAGSNLILGNAGGPSGGDIDRDYFRFTVPAGSTWTGLTLLSNTAVAGGFSFVAIQVGPQLTVSPTGAGASDLLGFAHYDNGQIGTNLLPVIVSGFSGALPSGIYSMWVQDTGGLAQYGFDVVLTSAPPAANVPLPAAALWLLAGLFGLTSLRRLRASGSSRLSSF